MKRQAAGANFPFLEAERWNGLRAVPKAADLSRRATPCSSQAAAGRAFCFEPPFCIGGRPALGRKGFSILLKKVMFWVMVLFALEHLAAIVYIMARGYTNLPAFSLVVASILATILTATVIRHLIKRLHRRQLELVYLLNGVMVAVNLLFLQFGTMATIDFVEMLAVGTLFDVLVSIVLVVLSRRHSRYVKFYRS